MIGIARAPISCQVHELGSRRAATAVELYESCILLTRGVFSHSPRPCLAEIRIGDTFDCLSP